MYVYKVPYGALYHVWFQNKSELYKIKYQHIFFIIIAHGDFSNTTQL